MNPFLIVPNQHVCKVMTIELLRILGHEIALADWSSDSKRVFWSACCTLFFGSFLIGEILSSSEKSFDPSSCLLCGDVKFRQNSILIHVKMPKVKSKEGDYVDLFEFEEKNCCPVGALWGLKKIWGVHLLVKLASFCLCIWETSDSGYLQQNC